MPASIYIQQELLKLNSAMTVQIFSGDIASEITRLILSKKFRKTSISEEQRKQVSDAVSLCVRENRPIQMTLVFGGYKLWRLPESPDVDWAELFSLMYYTKWMKPICDIYSPGVWFDFYSDDVIIPMLNNISVKDIEVYQDGFNKLLDFLREFQPINLSMTLNRVKDQYENMEAFNLDLESKKRQLHKELGNGLPILSDKAKSTIELNVRLKDGQKDNSSWREEVQFIHDAYALVDGRRPYYRRQDKICVFTAPYPGALSVGTTKDSIAKFWVGVGALGEDVKTREYRKLVLSPSQLENGKFRLVDLSIDGLKGKNFKSIRIQQ